MTPARAVARKIVDQWETGTLMSLTSLADAITAVLLARERETIETEARLTAVEAERDAARDQQAHVSQALFEVTRKCDALATALARYGRHEWMCDVSQGQRVGLTLPICTCGLVAAREQA